MPAIGGDEGHQGGAAADDPGPAEPEAAAEEEGRCNGQVPANTGGGGEEDTCFFDEDIGIATAKRAMSGIEVLDVDSKSISEMSLSSKREAAAAQGLPMLNLCGPDIEPDIAKRWGRSCKIRG